MNEFEFHIPAVLSHAYLITGGNAAGRLAYAQRLSAAYVCEGPTPPCGQCRHCVKAAGGIHPDISILEPEKDKREITIAQARELRANAYIRPNEAARKVFMINPADAMNENAQNALLKVLEDGPGYGAFLLLCARPGQLLDTIRSRCETLSLPPQEEEPDEELLSYAREIACVLLTGHEPEQAAYLLGLEQEGLKTAQLQTVLRLAEEELRPALGREPVRGVHLLRLLRWGQEACQYNIGPGHLLGMLCSAAQTRSIGGNRL